MIAKKDLQIAEEIERLINSLTGEWWREARRVLNVGLPLATAVNHGMVDNLSENGRIELSETRDALAFLLVARGVGQTIQEAWAAFDAC